MGEGRPGTEDESPCRGVGWGDKCLLKQGFQRDSSARLLAAKTSWTRENKPKRSLLWSGRSRMREASEKAQE